MVEKTLSEVMNKFEREFSRFHSNFQLDLIVHFPFQTRICQKEVESYGSLWLHSREKVTVLHEGLKDKVMIKGLDLMDIWRFDSRSSINVFDDSHIFT